MRVRRIAQICAACLLLACSACNQFEQAPAPPKLPPEPKPAPEGPRDTTPKPAENDEPAGPKAQASGSRPVTFGKKTLYLAEMPESWKEEEPANKMRLYQAAIAAPQEGGEAAELQIFKMMGAGGVDATLARWKSNQWGGDDAMESRYEVQTAAGEATIAVFSGSYTAMDFGPEKKAAKENFLMFGAIVPTETDGTFYIKLVGPRETVEPHRDAFEALVKSLKPKPE